MTDTEQAILDETGRQANHEPYDRRGEKNPFWGKHHSEETKQKIREAKIGKKLGPSSEERKLKISKANKGRKRSLEFRKHMSKIQQNGKAHFQGRCHSEKTKEKLREKLGGVNSPNRGRTFSEETRLKMSRANKGRKYPKEFGQKISKALKGKKLSEEHKRKLREAHVKFLSSGSVKRKGTSIEVAIENELRRRGITCIPQAAVEGISVADFLIPPKTVIQCNGDYWHGLPKRKNKDSNQDFLLVFRGYKVFRFSEKEIRRSPKRCVNKIIRWRMERGE